MNKVFIAASLDGFIADVNGGLEWLQIIPNPKNIDMGYNSFISSIDAIIMGRNTFETVCGFDCDWPYSKPVFVLSNSIEVLPEAYASKAELVSGDINKIISDLALKGLHDLYIDGGATIQSFLNAGLIDELIITTMPVLLGGGSSLFGELKREIKLKLIKSNILLGHIVQNYYKIEKDKHK